MSAAGGQPRVALIVGAGGGIGSAIAHRLARAGAALALADRDLARVEALAAELKEACPGVLALRCDAVVETETDWTVGRVVGHFGRLDILVHCVGVTGPSSPVHETAVAAWDDTLAINLRSAFLFSRAVVRPMLEGGYGRIVHLASIAGKEGNAGQAAYSVAKAGVMALVKSQGKELARTGIRVNAVAPAAVKTALVEQMSPELRAAMLAKVPMGRPGLPEEVANMVAWLASEECSFTTGATFDLSGGRATY
ncbi:SDR family oxidoreductase [Thauera sp. SDU_THAU2]|uniref:SDR family oxidoreductase n=1 Tax=Thauera sp. SDU_THAU2 TaxID=3136633 RepID=UPI00311FCD63